MEHKHRSYDDMVDEHDRHWERRHKRHFRSRHRGARDEDGPGAARVDRGWTTGLIHPSVTDKTAFVKRTYTSDGGITISNLNTVNNSSRGWSLNFVYDTVTNSCYAEVMLGSPQQGVGTPTGVVFQNLVDEFQALTNVFRYFKLTKFQIQISKLPQAVYQPSQVAAAPAGAQQQGGTWTNMGDPGRMLLRPWTGSPGVVNFTNGQLTAVDWDDHARYHKKKVESMVGHIDHPMKFCVTPVQPIVIPDTAHVSDTSGQLRYDAVPAIDISDFSTGVADASAYGIIHYWYFPACAGAITGFLNTLVTFEIEIEYFGLKPPTAFTPAPLVPAVQAAVEAGAVSSDSKEALIASLMNEKVKTYDPPAKPPKKVVDVNQLDEQKQDDGLSTAMSDVVLVPKAAQVNQQANVPATPPNTPKVKNLLSLVRK